MAANYLRPPPLFSIDYFAVDAKPHHAGEDWSRHIKSFFPLGTPAQLFSEILVQAGFSRLSDEKLRQIGEGGQNAIAYMNTLRLPMTVSNILKLNFLVSWDLIIIASFDKDKKLTAVNYTLDEHAL
ncbi:MAG TPA: hypothetical protein VEF76_06360 [Patescibacteria group bacterium]|nr:hypothetical protein [Patescibacteria group bacterium]